MDQKFIRETPVGDTQERDVCGTCGFINYVNPKIVTGSIVRHEDRILLCRRAIAPRIGFWTLPAGYMELGETAEQAAMREAREEANADIIIDRLLAVYTVPRIGQVQIMYLAHLAAPTYSAGVESLEVKLASWDEIPWNELAFPTVHWALRDYDRIRHAEHFAPFANPPDAEAQQQAQDFTSS